MHKQLRDILSFLKTNIIAEQVIKQPDKAEADRFYNFPYEAVEEVLSNAIYHKSYDLGSPIEVQVWSDKIEILSYPGPVNADVLKNQRRIVSREYRNRRIGDFLKELHLTEARGTGFPTIYDAMESNGSPSPIFETDDISYVLVTIPVHKLFQIAFQESNQVDKEHKSFSIKSLDDIAAYVDQASDQARRILDDAVHDKVVAVLNLLDHPKKRSEIFEQLELRNHNRYA